MIKLNYEVDRDYDLILCPNCHGAASRVQCTFEEIVKYGCGRKYECCSRAFVCSHCKERIVGKAYAPDIEAYYYMDEYND